MLEKKNLIMNVQVQSKNNTEFTKRVSSRRVVAIHQPNYFPWLGYFDKIALADVFILMDNAQFPKADGNPMKRVKILVHGRATWAGIPIVRTYKDTRSIKETRIDNSKPWKRKLLNTLNHFYARATFRKQMLPFLTTLVNNPTDSLSEYNTEAICSIASLLELDPSKLALGSTLNSNEYTSDYAIDVVDRVLAMVKAVNGTAFLAGGGAAYLCGGIDGVPKNKKFAEAGIEIVYQNYQHPVYQQCGSPDFVAGLSIIDALLNCGVDGTRQLIIHDAPNSLEV